MSKILKLNCLIKLGIYTIMNLNQALNNGLVSKKVHKVIKFNRNALVSEPNYHTNFFFTKNVLATALKKTEIPRNKNFYLGLLILELSKLFIYEFWYDYVKPKYGEKARLCCMDITSVIVYKKQIVFIKTLQKMLKLDLILQSMN